MSNENPNPTHNDETSTAEAGAAASNGVHANASGSNGHGQAAEMSAPPELVAKFEEALKEEKNKYLYLYAEFENFKKRAVKERSDLIKFGWEKTARDLLDVLDNFDRAIANMPSTTDQNFSTGIKAVQTAFAQTMNRQGVLPITTIGQTFNPELHEAMGQEPSELPSGTITNELVKGYTLHGRLLRPARVVISTGKPPAQA